MSELRDRRYASSPDEVEVRLPAGDVTEGVEGDVAGASIEDRFLGDDLLASVARLVHDLHEAASGFLPADEPFPQAATDATVEVVGHLDVTPQNVVVREGRAFALIDFDLAGQTTRFGDAYNAAMHWVPLRAPEDVTVGFDFAAQARRLRVFADASGWTVEERRALPRFGAEASARSWERMRHRAENVGGGWARMWAEGVGDLIRRREQWLLANEDAIIGALVEDRPTGDAGGPGASEARVAGTR